MEREKSNDNKNDFDYIPSFKFPNIRRNKMWNGRTKNV